MSEQGEQRFRLSEYDETIRVVLESGGVFRIYPSGTSMLPLLRQGVDSVLLKKPDGSLRPGDIAFYQRSNGAYVLHRVMRSENGGYVMCGDNQLVLESGISDSNIIGIVCEIYRKDKRVLPDNIGYRLYVAVWRSFFVRRVFFKLRSIFGKDGRV